MGALGDYSYNVNKNNSFECLCDLNFAIKDRFSIKESMQGSLLGRVGYILSDNLLPFFVGGVSFSDLGIKYSNEGSDYYSRNATQTGWRLGAGLEWKITPTWSIGAQYNYTDYNKLKLQLPIIYDLADVNGHASMHLITNNIQISFNHWFS